MGNPVTIAEWRSIKKGIIFDTGILIAIWKDEKRQGPFYSYFLRIPMEQRYCSVVAAFEFLNGISKKEFDNRRRWLKNKGIKFLEFSRKASKTFWNLFNRYRFQKELLCDMLIASTTLSLGYAIATNNVKDFEKIPGLDWIEEFGARCGGKLCTD